MKTGLFCLSDSHQQPPLTSPLEVCPSLKANHQGRDQRGHTPPSPTTPSELLVFIHSFFQHSSLEQTRGGCLELSLASQATWQAIVNVPTCRMDAREVPETAGVDELEAEDSEGLWRAGLAPIAKGQGQSEVCLPSGLALTRQPLPRRA